MKRTAMVLVGMLMVFGLSSAAWALPYSGADIELAGNEYSEISDLGTTVRSGGHEWYEEGDAIWTAWKNEWVEYEVELTEGNWNVGLNAINRGNLGDDGWYSQFKISNSLTSETITVEASDEEVFSGYINLDVYNAATYTVKYTWMNDKYNAGEDLDANIKITSVFFDDTDTPPVPEPGTVVLLGFGLLGLLGLKRRFHKK